jgi:hypothetical protein
MAKKLTDTATVILTNAAARDSRRVLPLPKLKAPAVVVQKTLKSLLADGLIEEIAADSDDEGWSRSEEHGRTTLIVTDAGLAAVGITGEAQVAATARTRAKPAKAGNRGAKPGKGTKAAKKAPRARTGDSGGRVESKQATVIAILRRANGASIEEMMLATDWRAHSVRGFMSGALKKRLKLEVVSEKNKKTGERATTSPRSNRTDPEVPGGTAASRHLHLR